MYGADVALALMAKFPGCQIFGLGGEKMLQAGVELEGDIRHTAAMGPLAAFSQLGSLFKVFRRLADRIEISPPDAAILIDFPDFNLRLAKRIKAARFPSFTTSARRSGRGGKAASNRSKTLFRRCW
jgi:lipid-A-disaccharide synthase